MRTHWKHLDESIASVLLKWIYTDSVSEDKLSLELMKAASSFGLTELMERCEKYLMGNVKLQDCVKLYTIAEELGTKKLRDHCSSLISCHWDDLSGEDFKEMPGPLLYQLLKAKSDYPLHSAVRLQREDVVFLYLVEHNAELPDAVNRLDNRGETALEVALKSRQPSLARTLVEHRADLWARDAEGCSLLHSAIRKSDSYAAEFIVEQLQNCGQQLDKPHPRDASTALHLLARHRAQDMLAVATRLIKAGLEPNAQNNDGWSPLHCCVAERNEPMLDVLLSCDSLNVDLRTRQGDTALCMALLAEPCFESAAAKLLAKGAAPNPRYPGDEAASLLHKLAREGRQDAALFLLESLKQEEKQLLKDTESLEARDREGFTVLHEAARSDLPRLCERLLELAPGLLAGRTLTEETAVHLAVSHGSLRTLEVLLAAEPDPQRRKQLMSSKDRRGETPLSLSVLAESRDKEILRALIEAGADIEQRNDEGYTALHTSINSENSDYAIFLIENGADLNSPTSSGETPMQMSVHCRLADVVEALCRRGADVNAGCPLWDALDSGQEQVAATLIAHGADPDCWRPGHDGGCQQTLLHKAIDENCEDYAIFLIKSGCDLNSPRRPPASGEEGGEEARDECTPLHLCCQWGLEQVVQTLIEHGANVNSRDAEGKTPLHLAIENQNDQIISLLLFHPNINLSLRDKKGLSPFATALVMRNNSAARAILEKLPSAAEQFDNKGRNFLHTAIQKNDMESILFLLSIRVNVNSKVQDLTGTPPLSLAAVTGNEVLVRSLLLAGAMINDTDAHRNTALHAASKAGHANVVSALLQNNINFDAVNADGDNALHVAVREGHVSVVRALLTECTLNAEAVNLKGRNPLHELARCGRDNTATNICELFFECMPDYPLNNAAKPERSLDDDDDDDDSAACVVEIKPSRWASPTITRTLPSPSIRISVRSSTWMLLQPRRLGSRMKISGSTILLGTSSFSSTYAELLLQQESCKTRIRNCNACRDRNRDSELIMYATTPRSEEHSTLNIISLAQCLRLLRSDDPNCYEQIKDLRGGTNRNNKCIIERKRTMSSTLTKIVASFVLCNALLLAGQWGTWANGLDRIIKTEKEAELINSFQTEEELLNYLGIEDPRKSDYDDGDSNSIHQRSAGNIISRPRMAACKPENQSVSTTEGNGTFHDPYVMFSPPCIRVQRCGGCCWLQSHACQPIKTETLFVQILGIRYPDSDHSETWRELRPIEQHLECKCMCSFGPEACNDKQVYSREECSCTCVNRDEEQKCERGEFAERQRWNVTTCNCDCRKEYLRECSTGYYYDQTQCACRKLQLFSHWFGAGDSSQAAAAAGEAAIGGPSVPINNRQYGVAVNDRRASYNNNNNNNNNGRQRTTDKPPVYVYTFAGADDPRRKHKDDPEY
ncbi:unnamed protein product [Trichogramma brassicae]|uniref:Platelet-derived growth factor (PDGF) family profile domain-containing protein n=1 Tax=Trichogramma brassicae TaxID=86971 RepID=A0A6H5IDJ8_9HYME|nr:unnamed protein product [Trichogramma brassicae]